MAMGLGLAAETAKKEGRLRPPRRGRARAALALVALLAGLALPLRSLVLADEPAPFSCGKGRCCCAGETADPGDRPCLRQSCGCGHEDATPAGEPLRIEAVLPASGMPSAPGPHRLPRTGAAERPLPQPHAPPVPPPKRPLPV